MLKIMRKMAAVTVMAVMMIVLAVSAGAYDYFNKPAGKDVVDGKAVEITDNTITVTGTLVKDKGTTIHYYMKGDATDPEFWNNSNAYVEFDVRLETDRADVFVIMPAFNVNWQWTGPSNYYNPLTYDKWVTVREPLSQYYGAFSGSKPMTICAQICTETTEAFDVQLTVKDIRITGLDGGASSAPEESTPEESTPVESTPEESTPEESTPEESTPEESTPEESNVEDSTPEESKVEDSTPEESKVEDNTPENTTAATTKPATTTSSLDDLKGADAGDITGVIVTVVVIAVVVVAGAVVGYLIYRKKKYY